MTNVSTELANITESVEQQLSDPKTLNTLVQTTFRGLEPPVMKMAIVEGMMRGFKFQDFLEKNVYAIPFKNGYSLITSIDYARKIGMRSGVIGKSAPQFEENNGKVISCTITIKRKANGEVGDYSETVYFNEYTTQRNLWTTKPRTMIAKVAEMHALRMACPEEMSQMYVEEEKESESIPPTVIQVESKIEDYKTSLESSGNEAELKERWASLPQEAKQNKEILKLKEELKIKLK